MMVPDMILRLNSISRKAFFSNRLCVFINAYHYFPSIYLPVWPKYSYIGFCLLGPFCLKITCHIQNIIILISDNMLNGASIRKIQI